MVAKILRQGCKLKTTVVWRGRLNVIEFSIWRVLKLDKIDDCINVFRGDEGCVIAVGILIVRICVLPDCLLARTQISCSWAAGPVRWLQVETGLELARLFRPTCDLPRGLVPFLTAGPAAGRENF